jgi:hypothetical protein
MLQRKSRGVSGTITSEIFARKESVARFLLLESDRIEAVDELPTSYRVRAKISALRRNLAKQALHFAPNGRFTQFGTGHDGPLLQMSISSIFAANGNGFISRWLFRGRLSLNARERLRTQNARGMVGPITWRHTNCTMLKLSFSHQFHRLHRFHLQNEGS